MQYVSKSVNQKNCILSVRDRFGLNTAIKPNYNTEKNQNFLDGTGSKNIEKS